MIEAQHKPAALFFFKRYIHRLMKKRFHKIIHLGSIPKFATTAGLLLTPNHISWWDGFFVDLFIDKVLPGRKIHLMMLESQLKRYRFFSKVGAFSVNPGKPKSVVESLQYAGQKLADPGNVVVIYPQGEIESQMKSELTFQSGIQKTAEYSPSPFNLAPLFFKIYYGSEREPEVYMQAFEPLPSGSITEYRNYFFECYAKFSGNCERYYGDKSLVVTRLL